MPASRRDGAPTKAFEPSLFVWATVMSRPTDDRAIVDAGLKALAFDLGPPLVCDEFAATYERASDEHGRLGTSGATNRLGLGDKIRLIPGQSDFYGMGTRAGLKRPSASFAVSSIIVLPIGRAATPRFLPLVRIRGGAGRHLSLS